MSKILLPFINRNLVQGEAKARKGMEVTVLVICSMYLWGWQEEYWIGIRSSHMAVGTTGEVKENSSEKQEANLLTKDEKGPSWEGRY